MEVDTLTRTVAARSVVAAAESGDRLAFSAAAHRYGSVAEAQELVRNKAVLRMADRVTAFAAKPAGLATTVRSISQPDSESVDSDTLFGHFTVWDAWYEVDSFFEGHFMERTVRGSTKKTISENRDSMRALFQHGTDPIAGDKPLGPIDDLREDAVGAYYEVPLLRDDDGELVDYVRSLVPGIRDGLYGASFRFRAVRDEWDYDAESSTYNPSGLPERSLREMQVMEFGPVTFPASRAATAQMRSQERADMPSISLLADMYELGQQFLEVENDPEDAEDRDRMAQAMEIIEALIEVEATEDPAGRAQSPRTPDRGNGQGDSAPPDGAGAELHPIRGRRATRQPIYGTKEEVQTWRLP